MEWKVYPLLDVRPSGAVSQLLFSSSEDYLLNDFLNSSQRLMSLEIGPPHSRKLQQECVKGVSGHRNILIGVCCEQIVISTPSARGPTELKFRKETLGIKF